MIEPESSSVAAATVWTFAAACSEADATAPVCSLACAATFDIFSADPFMREAAVDTAASALVAPSLNSRVNWSISAACRCFASCSAAFSAAAALAWTMPSRNTDSAFAIWPISSPPRLVSTSAERSPPASRVMVFSRPTSRATRLRPI